MMSRNPAPPQHECGAKVSDCSAEGYSLSAGIFLSKNEVGDEGEVPIVPLNLWYVVPVEDF
jgi:hypothetical protein